MQTVFVIKFPLLEDPLAVSQISFFNQFQTSTYKSNYIFLNSTTQSITFPIVIITLGKIGLVLSLCHSSLFFFFVPALSRAPIKQTA